MSAISVFEQHTRDALAILVLNKFRRWLLGREKKLSDNKAQIIGKSIGALQGKFDSIDMISYYFKDSGEIDNPIVFQLGKVFNEILPHDPEQREKFSVLILTLLKEKNPGVLDDGDKRFIHDILEGAIYFIDDKMNITEANSSHQQLILSTKGF